MTLAPARDRTTPEEALATPGAFLRWLLEAQDKGRCVVGHRISPTRCPLATFARGHLGVQGPVVACSCDGDEGYDAAQGLRLHYRAGPHKGDSVPLPPWCIEFVARVDAAPVRAISPRRALRILGEVLMNREHAP